METEPQLIEQYLATGKAKLVYRHLLQLGEATRFLSEASECAGAQGKFWEMRALIYRQQSTLYSAREYATLEALVEELGLDGEAFQQCVETGEFRQQVQDDYEVAQREGIVGRPVMDIDGTRIVGAQPFGQYQRALEAAQE